MKAKHVDLKYDISDYTELDEFLNISITDKIRYIIHKTPFIKNYIIDSVEGDTELANRINEMSTDDILHDSSLTNIVDDVITYIRDAISEDNASNHKLITPYIDTLDMPSFLIYSKETKIHEDMQSILYVNDDAITVYKDGFFSRGIIDLDTPNKFIDVSEDETSFNIGYNVTTNKKLLSTENLLKLSKVKKIMAFLLFRGVPMDLYNNIANTDVCIYNNTDIYNVCLIYQLDGIWYVYGNNKNLYSSDSIDDLIGWIGDNIEKYEKYLNYNPKYLDNLNDLRKDLIKQTMSNLSNSGGATMHKHENKKPVVQIDMHSGYRIKNWESASDASKSLGISRTSITKVANGHGSSAGGFKWEFI